MRMRSVIFTVAVGCLSSWAAVAQGAGQAPVSAEVLVLDSGGAPLAGLEVVCVKWESERAPRTEPLTSEEKAVTDANGMCRFNGLTHYAYHIWAVHGVECISEQMMLSSLEGAPFEVRMKPGVPVYGYVHDTDGAPLGGVQVVYFRGIPLTETDERGLFTVPVYPGSLELSLVKEGYAWRETHVWTRLEIVLEPGGAIEGRVVDDQGQALGGATVNCESAGSHFEFQADPNGAFRTPWLAPDKEANFRAYFENEEAHYQGEMKTELVAGEVREIVIATEKTVRMEKLSPEDAAAREREFAAQFTTVSGQVIHAQTGEPVQATIYKSQTIPSAAEFDYYKRKGGHTDPDGTFTLEKLQKGRPLFIIAAPDDPLLYPVEAIVRVEVGDEPTTGLVLTVAPGAAVGGTVVTADGEPVLEGDVMLIAPDFRQDKFLKKDNRFQFPNLPPGTYQVQVGDTTIETGRLEAGQSRDDIAVTLPRVDLGTLVEGTLLDESGRPIGGADVALRRDDPPASERAETDAGGHFSTRVKEPGTYTLSVWETFSLVTPGTNGTGRGEELTIVGDAQVVVPADGTVSLQVAARRKPWPKPMLGGIVRDQSGKPLDAEVTIMFEEFRDSRVEIKQGVFLEDRLPEGPFLLEVVMRGYEARVLESGRDFEPGDRDLVITLEPGPFEEGESIWTQVTGRPATEEAVQEMWLGKAIRGREDNYRRMAEPVDKTPPVPLAPETPGTIQIHVTNLEGQPVQRIVVHAAESMGGYDMELSPLVARPAHASSSEIMTSDDGTYEVRNRSLVDSEGAARSLVMVRPEDDYQPPLELKVGPPARVVIKALDLEGRPVSGAAAGPVELMQRFDGRDYAGLPESDASGQIVFDGIAAGEYWIGVGAKMKADPDFEEIRWPMPPRLVRMVARPGEETSDEVVLPLAEKGGPEAKLMEWERRVAQGSLREPEFGEAIKAIDGGEKRRIVELMVVQLEQMSGVCNWNRREAEFFARLTLALGEPASSAAVEFKRLFATDLEGFETQAGFGGWMAAFVDAILELDNDDSIEYWLELAKDPGAPWVARTFASAALGRLDTKKSVAAWIALRDAARTKPGAPPEQASYTHAQKMAEAVIFAAQIIPDGAPVAPLEETAWVDEAYASGRIEFNGNNAELRRFGDEWLVTHIETIPIAIP